MGPDKFDPFKYRLARDIRNSLSRSLLKSIAEKDAKHFQNRAAGYLKQIPDQVYQDYIQARLAAYEDFFTFIMQANINDTLQQSAILWDYGLYFEMHELLETVWIKAVKNRRRALQGLIRAAGMKMHLENGNAKAAASMGSKALQALQLYGSELQGFDRLDLISAEIKDALAGVNDPP